MGILITENKSNLLHKFKNDRGRSEPGDWNLSRITVYNSSASVPDGEIFWEMLLHAYLYSCGFQCLMDIVSVRILD